MTRRRAAAGFRPRRPGAGDHADRRDRARAPRSRSRSRYRGQPRPIIDAGRLAERLDPDRRRRLRRRRAAGLADLVSVQRPPDRQGDLRLPGHGPERHRGGRQRSPRPAPGPTPAERRDVSTWTYAADQPMATYLATATIGKFRIERTRFDGIESLVAVDPREARRDRESARMRRSRSQDGDHPASSRRVFGPYPFGQTGRDRRPRAGGRLRARDPDPPDLRRAPGEVTVAHEIAHQWFGDSVSLERWDGDLAQRGLRDLGASGAGTEEAGGRTTAQVLARLERTPASRHGLWDPPPRRSPRPRGAVRELGLHPRRDGARGAAPADRRRAFYATLRAWASTHAYGNATIEEFIALAEARSGQRARRSVPALPVQAGQALAAAAGQAWRAAQARSRAAARGRLTALGASLSATSWSR